MSNNSNENPLEIDKKFIYMMADHEMNMIKRLYKNLRTNSIGSLICNLLFIYIYNTVSINEVDYVASGLVLVLGLFFCYTWYNQNIFTRNLLARSFSNVKMYENTDETFDYQSKAFFIIFINKFLIGIFSFLYFIVICYTVSQMQIF